MIPSRLSWLPSCHCTPPCVPILRTRSPSSLSVPSMCPYSFALPPPTPVPVGTQLQLSLPAGPSFCSARYPLDHRLSLCSVSVICCKAQGSMRCDIGNEQKFEILQSLYMGEKATM